jgi:hypothetical protein
MAHRFHIFYSLILRFLLYSILLKTNFHELFARATKMNNELDAKINTTIAAEIERIFSEINGGKLTAELKDLQTKLINFMQMSKDLILIN